MACHGSLRRGLVGLTGRPRWRLQVLFQRHPVPFIPSPSPLHPACHLSEAISPSLLSRNHRASIRPITASCSPSGISVSESNDNDETTPTSNASRADPPTSPRRRQTNTTHPPAACKHHATHLTPQPRMSVCLASPRVPRNTHTRQTQTTFRCACRLTPGCLVLLCPPNRPPLRTTRSRNGARTTDRPVLVSLSNYRPSGVLFGIHARLVC